MIMHMMKMLWNQRKQFAGIYIEQLLVFIILVVCLISFSGIMAKCKDPGLLNTKNTVVFGYMNPRQDVATIVETQKQMEAINSRLRKLPYVTAISESITFIPYMNADENNLRDSVDVDNRSFLIYIKGSDKYGASVFQPVLQEGGWLTDEKLEDGTDPAVVTRQLVDLLGWSKALGKKIHYGGITFTVVGVMNGIKQNALTKSPAALIVPVHSLKNIGFMLGAGTYCVRLKNEFVKNDFTSAYLKEFAKQVTDKQAEPIIMDLEKMKLNSVADVIFRLIFQSVPTLFLFLFAFIGTFGLFWLNAKKRNREFALRLAVGSSKRKLFQYVITESLVLVGLAIFPGLILTFLIFNMTSETVAAILCAVIVMLIFTVFSAWYPAYVVAKTDPAEALHNE